MRVIIAGSRTITDYNILVREIKASGFEITQVVSGSAKGVDRLGIRYAKENNIPYVEYKPDWETYGKSAGYRRNVDMANNADALIALWDTESFGTRHMINIALAKGLKMHVCNVELDTTIVIPVQKKGL